MVKGEEHIEFEACRAVAVLRRSQGQLTRAKIYLP